MTSNAVSVFQSIRETKTIQQLQHDQEITLQEVIFTVTCSCLSSNKNLKITYLHIYWKIAVRVYVTAWYKKQNSVRKVSTSRLTKWYMPPAKTACMCTLSDQNLPCPHEESMGPCLSLKHLANTLQSKWCPNVSHCLLHVLRHESHKEEK